MVPGSTLLSPAHRGGRYVRSPAACAQRCGLPGAAAAVAALSYGRSFWEYTEQRAAGNPAAGRSRLTLCRKRAAAVALSNSKELTSVHKAGVDSLALELVEHRYLLAGAGDGSIAAYDTELPTPAETDQGVVSVGERGDAKSSGRLDTHDALFHIKRTRARDEDGHAFGVTSVQWYPVDSGLFLTASYDATVKVWDSNTLQVANSFEVASPVHSIAMSPLATAHCLIAAASSASQIRLADVASTGFAHTLTGHRSGVWAVQWSVANEFVLYSGGCDGAIRAWDVRRAGSFMVFDQHNAHDPSIDVVDAATSHPHGGSNASFKAPRKGGYLSRQGFTRMSGSGASACRAPNDVRLRKSSLSIGGTLGAAQLRVTAHSGEVTALLPVPGGRHLLSAGRDGRVRLWDVHSGKNTLVNYGGTYSTGEKGASMACSEDGRSFFVPCGSSLKVYDTQSGRHHSTLKGHFANINCCVSNPRTLEVFSGSTDRQILVWEPPRVAGAIDPQQPGTVDQEAGPSHASNAADADADAWSDDD